MRVLHVISGIDSRFGGPTAALAGLAPFQRRAGMDVRVVASYLPNFDSAVAEQLEQRDVPVRLIGPTRQPLRRHPDIAKVLGEEVPRADVVHIHALWEEIQHQAARHAHRAGKPWIYRTCGMLDPWSLANRRLKKQLYMWWRLRWNLNNAAALHVTSKTESEMVGRLALRAPILTEPNGVDVDAFQQPTEPGAFRKAYPSLKGRPLLLLLSRIHPAKGIDLLIPALARLKRADAMLAIAGPDQGGYQARMEALAASCGVADRVVFPGTLSGTMKVAALCDADLFVMPSYHENFGISIVESLAAGTPVVISEEVNIYREIVEAGVGEAVPTQVDPLVKAIDRWLDDDARRADAVAKARAFVRDRYDWRAIAQRWHAHYQRIVEGRLGADAQPSTSAG